MRSLAILVLCLLSTAHADEQKARKLFQLGAKAYAAQSFATAAAHFDEAYKEAPVPEIAFSAAQAYRRLYRVDPKPEHVRRAVELYRVYLANVKTGGRVGDASDNLGEMQSELDKLEARTGKIKVETASIERTRITINIAKTDQASPEAGTLREIGEGTGDSLTGVVATLDGTSIEPFALLDVEPGEHVVTVTADGYFPIEKKQRAVQGVVTVVDLELVPRPAKVKVTTESGARIIVDGRPAGSASSLELPAGKHLITVMRDGRRPFGRELSVVRGQELTLDARLEKTGRRRAVPWVLGGAGGLAVAAAITGIAAVVADGKAIDARDQISAGNASPALADEYDGQVGRRDDLKTTSIVFGAGALIAGTVGLGLYLFDSPSASHGSGVRIAPVATPGGAGVTIGSRF